jgi:hypothetical protein
LQKLKIKPPFGGFNFIMKEKLIVIILIFSFYSHSQELLFGKIIDENAGTPIIYAHIYIKNTSIGAITNEDGQFKLIIPEIYKNNSVVISSLGFEIQDWQINEVLKQTPLLFKLNPNTQTLEEVLITSKPDYTPFELVQKALENHYNTFFKKQYLAKGFIRHSEKTKEEYKLLIEAAFEIYNLGKKNDININLLQTRKSIDNRVLDTVYIIIPYLRHKNNSGYNKKYRIAENLRNKMSREEIENAIAFYDNHYTAGYNKKLGLLEKILSSDINKVRNYDKKRASLTKKSLKNFTFKKDTIVYLNDDKVTKISFSLPNKRAGKILLGSFYIRNSDFAIIESNFHSLFNKSHSYYRATGNRIRYSTKVKYKEFNNVMYPFYISHKSFKINGIYLGSDKTPLDGNYTQQEILFSEIIENQDPLNNFSSRVKNLNNNIFIKKKYNKEFWDSYTILLESKEDNQMIKDLEKRVSLKEQFERQ